MTARALPDREAQKSAAALAAVAEVEAGMCVGLGTGTTAAYAIEGLGQRCRQGLRITAFATSLATEAAAHAAGIPLGDFAEVAAIDLCIDGVDEIDGAFRAIKGGGGAMLREKIVAAAADRMIAIADATKRVGRLGGVPVPVEIAPFAAAFAAAAIGRIGGRPVPRVAAGVPFRTDQGNAVLDCTFPAFDDPAALARALSSIPGVLGHGLFLDEIDALYLGTPAGVVKLDRFAPASGDPGEGTGAIGRSDRSVTAQDKAVLDE